MTNANTEILRQIVQSNRSLFDNGYQAGVAIQDETEKVVNTLLEKAPWVNEGVRNAINTWAENFKKGRQSLKDAVDQNYSHLEGILGA